jgi:hypothetical protein
MAPRLSLRSRCRVRARGGRRALALALAILFALTPVSAHTLSLPQLLQMPFEQLLRLQITGPVR